MILLARRWRKKGAQRRDFSEGAYQRPRIGTASVSDRSMLSDGNRKRIAEYFRF
jgi:hypothetical protein